MERFIRLRFASVLLIGLVLFFGVRAAGGGEIRKAVWAGKFYPENSSELRRTIHAFLAEVPESENASGPPAKQNLKALILPHAGYIYSGRTAAHGCALLKNRQYKRVILMGPDHRIGFANVGISSVSAYATPLGTVPLHADAEKLRAESPLFHAIPASDRVEHSLEVVLPFLQVMLNDFSLVPMVMGSRGDYPAINRRIAGMVDADTLIVVSSDLSHFLPDQAARKKDHETIRMILNLEDEKLRRHENAACGVLPICSVIYLAKRFHWKPTLIHYANSGDTAGTGDRVVGYTAIAFYGEDS